MTEIYQIKGPDGQVYDVKAPDGVSPIEMTTRLQSHFGKITGKVPQQEPMGAGEQFITGMQDPLVGGRQLYSHIAQSPEQAAKVDLAVKAREAEIAAKGGGGVMRGFGEAATTAPLMAAGGSVVQARRCT